ncbi:MAG: AtpZ/AtpI family protein [Planctomycetota bacterium]
MFQGGVEPAAEFLPGAGRTVIFPRLSRVRATDRLHGDQDRKALRRYLRFAAAGTQFCIVMALFTLGGIWLDGKVRDLRPLFTILGAALGMAFAMTSLIVQVLRSTRKP